MPTHPPRGLAAALLLTGALAATVAAPHAAAQETHAATPSGATATGRAKNVIMLIGDGMGYQQTDMASLWQHGTTYRQISRDPVTGTTRHLPGTPSQVFQSFPVQTWMSTSSLTTTSGYKPWAAWADFDWVKGEPTDSAAAGTALATGVRTYNANLGVDGQGQRVTNSTEVAERGGRATGVVTSVPFSHATPAAFVVHNDSRLSYHEIARQMLGSDLEVIMGGGHPEWSKDHTRTTPHYDWISQARFADVTAGRTPFRLVESRSQFADLAAATPGSGATVPTRVLGLAQVAATLQANRSGASNGVAPYSVTRNDVPALSTMATGALNVLSRDPDGFFLMVEGGAIDWTSHANDETRLIEETVDFTRTVDAVVRWVETYSSWQDTLVVVTADHETGYLAGPGADPTWTPMTGSRGQVPRHSWHSDVHTNQLVPLYAKGVGAGRLSTAADQQDPVRGAYLDNTEVAQAQHALMGR